MADVSVTLQPGQEFPVSVTDQLTASSSTAPLTNINVAVASLTGIAVSLQSAFGSQITFASAGVQGAPGQAASISIGTTTIGSPPAVANSGTSSAAVLDFTLPGSSGGSSDLQPANTVAPSTGDTLAYFGYTFTVSNGNWTNSPSTFAYQWKISSDGTNWTSIAGATSNSLSTDSTYQNKYIRCQITASNIVGSGIAYSNTVGPLQALVFPTGALAYYSLDNDGNGNLSLADSTSNAFNLTAVSDNSSDYAGLNSSGIKNGCASFDGLHAQPLQSYAFSGLSVDAFSISFWFNPSSQNNGYPQILTTNGSTAFFGDLYFSRSDGNTGKFTFYGSGISGNTIFDSGSWHLAVLVADGTNVNLYIDGNSSPELTDSISGPYTPDKIGFGGANDLNIVTSYTGYLDEIGIWQRALNSVEISALYGNGTPPAFVS